MSEHTNTDRELRADAGDEVDPVQDLREHLEQALASLDRLREVLPGPDAGGRS